MPFGNAFAVADEEVMKFYTQDANPSISLLDENIHTKFTHFEVLKKYYKMY